MKASDIDRIHAAGLITPEQRRAIIAHFELDQDRNRLLQVLAILGGLLVSAGLILLIASNWDSIPKLVRLGAGLALMLGAQFAGWRVMGQGNHPAVGAALHLIGSFLFLGNIALVGQAYNLSSRLPDAIILWLAGIAPLAWILRSKAQFLLSLAVFGFWMALEMNETRSWFYFGSEARQLLFFALLGLAFHGGGSTLRLSAFPEFAPPTEKFGILVFHIASFPLTVGAFYSAEKVQTGAWILCGLVTLVGVAMACLGVLRNAEIPTAQWRVTWALILVLLMAMVWVGMLLKFEFRWSHGLAAVGPHWVAIPVLFTFCLLQAQVGILSRSPFLLNLAITFIGLHLVSAYVQLFGSMFDTGLVFLAGGVLLIGLAVFLERKRRSLMSRMSGAGVPGASQSAHPEAS